MAGLLNNLSQDDRQAIPLLSQLPIIGNLFKSKATRAEQTELMVLITPRLVRPMDPDEVPPLPTRFKPFMTPKKTRRRREEGQGQRQRWRSWKGSPGCRHGGCAGTCRGTGQDGEEEVRRALADLESLASGQPTVGHPALFGKSCDWFVRSQVCRQIFFS